MQALARRIIIFVSRHFSKQDRSVYQHDFNECAHSYDSAVTRPILSAVTQRAVQSLDLRPGMRCIDLGCGTGDATAHLHNAVRPGGKVFACDFSHAMIGEARRRLDNPEDVFFIEGDMHSCLSSFDAGSIDMIGSFWSLEYCDHADILSQAHRTLAPGGKLCVVVNHRNSLGELQSLVTPVIVRNILALKRIPPLGMIDSGKSLAALTRKAGFHSVSISEETAEYRFASGDDLVRWIREGGPSAGLRGSIRKKHLEKIYRAIKDAADKRGGLTVTFRFSVLTAVR